MQKNLIKIYLETISFIIFPQYIFDNCNIIKYHLIDPITKHYHFDIRFNDKYRNPYDVETIQTIINKGINKYNSDKQYKQYHEISTPNTLFFSLQSKTKNLVKIKLEFIKTEIITNGTSRYKNKYCCILHTLLNKNQYDYSKDINILVKEDADLAYQDQEDSFINTIPLVVD